jgi:hypothetical protein
MKPNPGSRRGRGKITLSCPPQQPEAGTARLHQWLSRSTNALKKGILIHAAMWMNLENVLLE